MAKREIVVGDLDYLREESRQTVLFCVIGAVYIWLITVLDTSLLDSVRYLLGFLWELVIVMSGVLIAFLARNRGPSLASASIIACVVAAMIHNMWLVGMGVAPYLLTIAVSLTGLLFSMKHVVWVTMLCSGAVIAFGVFRWDYPPLSAELLSPVMVIAAVGVLSSLAVRNLYWALHWALDRAMAAQRNEKEARERQAQLARTLKALDEAYRRLERMNYDLTRAREVAEEAKLTQQRFAANVSHELRTPLNVIMAFSETMYLSPESYGGVPLPPSYRGDVREIYRGSKHLLSLIDDVLAMSRMEARRLRINPEPVSLHKVVIEALEMIRPLAWGKAIDLHIALPEDLPLVLIDRARVRQVLLNLLNNALRFTEQGGITVQAVHEESELVQVTVADTGVGIPPGEHGKVFEEFRQADGVGTRGQGGSGLGLALSKRLVGMHGGRIWVESDGIPGHGSRFHFTLPVAGSEIVEVSTLHRTPKPIRHPIGRGRVLLLLGEDPAAFRGLDEYSVVAVDDVSEVPALADKAYAQAILVNSARRGQAQQQARALRRELGDSSLPIILCPLVDERQLGEAVGAVDYLVKPITREVLVGLLDRLGEDVGHILVVDDDPVVARIVTRLLSAAGYKADVACAYDGEEGLERMRSTRPDLVLLDLVMPGMDGYSLLAHMREDNELQGIPVALITAQERSANDERRLGDKTLSVSIGAGFTNEQVLAYVRAILDVDSVLSPLPHAAQVVEGGE